MNVTCHHCQKRYLIADEKVRGRSVKIRCKRCESVITIEGEEGKAGGSPAAAPPSNQKAGLDLASVWFALLQGKQQGPMDVKLLEGKIRSGEIGQRTYLWRQGMPSWKRAGELAELAPFFAPEPQAAPAEPPPPPEPEENGAPQPEESVARSPRSAQPLEEQPARAEAIEDAPTIAARDPMGELFSDVNLPESEKVEAETSEPAGSQPEDPFAALGEIDPAKLGPPGEATRYFIAQAGVNRRNPPWKIALAVVLAIAAPLGVLYFLSELKIVPLEVTRLDESGREVKQSVFSAGGMAGLRDLLAGKKKAEPPAQKAVSRTARAPGPTVPSASPPEKPALPPGVSQADLKQLYNDEKKQDVGPKLQGGQNSELLTAGGGLSQEKANRVVQQNQKAFQGCLDQQLRKNPSFKQKKVEMQVTVGTSGLVTEATLTDPALDQSELGECLRGTMKRLVFPSFEGYQSAEFLIPLNLTTAM